VKFFVIIKLIFRKRKTMFSKKNIHQNEKLKKITFILEKNNNLKQMNKKVYDFIDYLIFCRSAA